MTDAVRNAPALEELHLVTSDATMWLYDDLFQRDADIMPRVLQNPNLKKIVCRGKKDEERMRSALARRNIDTRIISLFEFEEDPLEILMKYVSHRSFARMRY